VGRRLWLLSANTRRSRRTRALYSFRSQAHHQRSVRRVSRSQSVLYCFNSCCLVPGIQHLQYVNETYVAFYRRFLSRWLGCQYESLQHTYSPCDVCSNLLSDSLLRERDYIMFGSLLSQIRLSVVCLYLTLMRPIQVVEDFGNISLLLCTLAIL